METTEKQRLQEKIERLQHLADSRMERIKSLEGTVSLLKETIGILKQINAGRAAW